jgi:hypothetical protein
MAEQLMASRVVLSSAELVKDESRQDNNFVCYATWSQPTRTLIEAV